MSKDVTFKGKEILFSEEMTEKLEAVAKARGVTKEDIIREIIKDGFDEAIKKGRIGSA